MCEISGNVQLRWVKIISGLILISRAWKLEYSFNFTLPCGDKNIVNIYAHEKTLRETKSSICETLEISRSHNSKSKRSKIDPCGIQHCIPSFREHAPLYRKYSCLSLR